MNKYPRVLRFYSLTGFLILAFVASEFLWTSDCLEIREPAQAGDDPSRFKRGIVSIGKDDEPRGEESDSSNKNEDDERDSSSSKRRKNKKKKNWKGLVGGLFRGSSDEYAERGDKDDDDDLYRSNKMSREHTIKIKKSKKLRGKGNSTKENSKKGNGTTTTSSSRDDSETTPSTLAQGKDKDVDEGGDSADDRKLRKVKRRKMRKHRKSFWQSFPPFMDGDDDDDSTSVSMESSKRVKKIEYRPSANGSPAFIIVPQTVYNFRYKIYKGGKENSKSKNGMQSSEENGSKNSKYQMTEPPATEGAKGQKVVTTEKPS